MFQVLIIEDDDAKADTVAKFLSGEAAGNAQIEIHRACHLSEAMRLVSGTVYNLIVLDLMLPYIANGQVESRAGLEMLGQIRREDGLNAGTAIVGLSAFPDEVRDWRSRFENAGVLIVAYDERGRWRDALRRTLADAARRQSARSKVDFLILTALDEERSGYAGTDLVEEAESIVAGLNVRHVRLATSDGHLRGALIKLRQMGLAAATLDAAIALGAFDTRLVCMSGICAGFSAHSKLGQLLVASPAWEYQAGKWSDDGFQIAPTQIPLPAATRVALDQLVKSAEFHEAIEAGVPRSMARPSVWTEPALAPGATGSAVIADRGRLEHIKQQHRKLATLDMETFGVYYAAHEVTPSVEHYFSVKCVVDLADSHKSDDLHQFGCAVSARATIFMLRRLLSP